MKLRSLKRISLIAMAAVLSIGMMAPTFSINSVSATGGSAKTINIGTDAITVLSGGWTKDAGNQIVFGKYDNTEVTYNVLSNGDGKMLIDSANTLLNSEFDSTDNDYATSTVRNLIKDGNQFFPNDKEKAIVESTSLASNGNLSNPYAPARYTDSYGFYDDSSDGNYSFLLTAQQVSDLYASDTDAKKTGAKSYWWLRSATSYSTLCVGVVKDGTLLHYYMFTGTLGVAPASNINLSSVLFSTDVGFDKTAAVSEVNTTSTKTWRLTIKDTSLSVTAEEGKVDKNKKVSVPVTLSGTGIDQVSVAITNGDISSSDTEILYYGKMDGITTTSTSQQTGTFTLPDDFDTSTDKIYLLAEDLDSATSDFASNPVEISTKYEVDFDTNGATSGTASQQIVDLNGTVTAPTGILKTGYILNGWFDNSALFGDAYDFNAAVTKAMTLYAKWVAENYAITYDLNGGSVTPANPTSYTIEDAAITLNAPTKANLSFAGWTSTSDSITTPQKTVTIAHGSTGARDYTANWNATITFDTKGGSAVADKVVAEGTVVNENDIAATTKDGLHFAGWYDDEDYNTKHDFTKAVTKNTKLYAKWEAKVTFNSNGGSDVATKTVAEGAKVTEPDTDPTKANLHFAGWYTDSDCTDGNEFDFTNEAITADKTLYAKWTADVTFDAKGGTPAPSKQTVKENANAVAPAETITKLGYIFINWYDNASYFGNPYDFSAPVTGNLALYAKWAADGYPITYTLNGGSEPSPANPTSYTIEDAAITLNAPTKANLSFAGWTSTSDSITTPQKTVTIAHGSTGARDYTANWNATITFDTKGGSAVADKVVAEGTVVNENDIAATTKDGLHFAGWYDDEDYNTKHDFTKAVTKNTKLYAKWEAKVTFDINGQQTTISVAEGDKLPKQEDPVKEGYIFLGWKKVDAVNAISLLATANATQYYDFDTPVEGPFTLVAEFEPIEYTVTYKGMDDATVSGNPESYTIESETITLNSPTKTGYAFSGWTTDGVTEPTKDLKIEQGSTGNKTFTANWVIYTYTVTFDDGTDTTKVPVDYDHKVTRPDDPTKDGYKFGGWFADQACTTTWDFDEDTVTKDLTLYAKWIKTDKDSDKGGSGSDNNGSNSNGAAGADSDTSDSDSLSKTGDDTNVLGLLAILTLAGAGAGTVFIRRRHG